MDAVPLVAFTRGLVLESIHYGSVAVVDSRGEIIASVGDPDRLTTLRSSAKPLQAMAVVETGAIDRFSGTAAELAVIAGSHSGEPGHTDTVARMLERVGFSAETLQCGTHVPFDREPADTLARQGLEPSPLHHNCSGNHTGMLWACAAREWDERTYVRPDHPLQRRIRSVIGVMSDWPEAEIPIGIDGCTAPTFSLPLLSLALAYARIAAVDELTETHAEAARRVREAMVEHPEMVGGEGRFDTDLMRAGSGRLLSKSGAEGCHALAVLGSGWGIGVKIEDGAARAGPIVALEVLRQLSVLEPAALASLARHANPIVRNHRGEVVGEGHPLFALTPHGRWGSDLAPAGRQD